MTPNSDGPVSPPALAESPGTPPEENLAAMENVPDAAESLPDKEFLRRLGVTRKVAQRMLMADGKSEAFLNTRVTARVYLVHQTNSAEEIMKAQRKANSLGSDTDQDGRTRAACLAVVAQCGMALARLSEVALATARNLDVPEEGGGSKVVKPVQNNYFGFPPVAEDPRNPLTPPAKIGTPSPADIPV